MSPSRKPTLLLVLLILVLGGLGTGLVILLQGAAADDGGGLIRDGDSQPVAVAGPRDEPRAPLLPPREDLSGEPVDPSYTNVLWPLEVDLELLQADRLPVVHSGQQVGAGASAALSGRIVDRAGRGVAARVEFVAGPNQGRVLHCDSMGDYGATDLYPGLDIVEVAGPGILGSRREVRLRRRAEQKLNIGYGMPAVIWGKVVDTDGEPVVSARVWIDGQLSTTDIDGQFYIPQVASGKTILEIEAEGYAPWREDFNVAVNQVYKPGTLFYRLQKPASIRLSIPAAVGGPGPAQVFLLPSNTRVQRNYPWYRINPVSVQAGGTTLIQGLPSCVVEVRVFHEGAMATPRSRSVNLRAGEVHEVEVHLQQTPLLTGSVMLEGQPVPGATVRLEAPDRVGATLGFFRETAWYLESEVLEPIPPASQEVRTDAAGRFVMTAWSELIPVRYLEAEGPDGLTWAARLVDADDTDVTLELEPLPQGQGRLMLHMPRRHQGLPIQVRINGAPQEPMILPDHESLVLDGLEEGSYRLTVRFYDQELLPASVVAIRGTVERLLELPPKAIEGHSEEQWRQAGRTYPRR